MERFDYKAAVLFWCSDLTLHGPLLGLFEVRTPGGRVVGYGKTTEGAWIKTLGLIQDHLEKTRKEREEYER